MSDGLIYRDEKKKKKRLNGRNQHHHAYKKKIVSLGAAVTHFLLFGDCFADVSGNLLNIVVNTIQYRTLSNKQNVLLLLFFWMQSVQSAEKQGETNVK